MPPRKPAVEPGNPLWLAWVESLAAHAEAQGSKAANTYKKAAASLRACPVPFDHPEEACELAFVGPKIVATLTRNLEEHCRANGVAMPVPKRVERVPVKKKPAPKRDTRDEVEDEEARDAAKALKRARLMPPEQLAKSHNPLPVGMHGYHVPPLPPPPPPSERPVNPNSQAPAVAENGRLLPSDDEDSDASVAPAKRKGSSKPYVPRKHSGSYAILLGLYLACTPTDHGVLLTKSEIIRLASPHSSSSFDVPADGKGTYTAWSSISALVQRNLVRVELKAPKRWALTRLGFALAETLAPLAGVDVLRAMRSDEDLWSGGDLQPRHRLTGKEGSGAVWFDDDGDNTMAHRQPAPLTADASEEDQLNEAIRLSLLESAPARSAQKQVRTIVTSSRDALASASGSGSSFRPSGARRASVSLPLPLPLPLPKPVARDPLPSSSSSSSSGGGAGVMGRRKALDPRKAATGGYAAMSLSGPPPEPTNGVDGPFGYHYLDENDQRVRNRSQAEVGQEDASHSFAPTYRIEFRIAQDLHAMARSVVRKSSLPLASSGGKTRTGYLRARVADDVCPGFLDEKKGRPEERAEDARASLLGAARERPRVDKGAMYAPPPEIRRFHQDVELSSPEPVPANSSSSNALPLSVPAPRLAAPPVARTTSLPTTTTTTAPAKTSTSTGTVARTLSAPSDSALKRRPLVMHASFDHLPSYNPTTGLTVNRHPLDAVKDHASLFPPSFAISNPLIVPSGSFKVVLVVDTRETAMGRHGAGRNDMVDQLQKAGVEVDMRMLPLGDMIWVARRIREDGTPTGDDDIVLDAIIERKRLDDLCNSIIDGRYMSQKVRIKNSAISHRIYLIERYQVEANYKQYGQQIRTAKSQLQINDGFYVHESSSLKDTVHYLRLRTQVMIELYASKSLTVIPDGYIDRPSFLGLQKHLRSRSPATNYLTTYNGFELLNKADAALTLKSAWASMVLRVAGVSAEKARPFVARWPTPRIFFDEVLAHRLDVEREIGEGVVGGSPVKGRGKPKRRKPEDFVVEQLEDDGPRAIKGKLGAKLYDLFMTANQYPPKDAK